MSWWSFKVKEKTYTYIFFSNEQNGKLTCNNKIV